MRFIFCFTGLLRKTILLPTIITKMNEKLAVQLSVQHSYLFIETTTTHGTTKSICQLSNSMLDLSHIVKFILNKNAFQ